MMSSSAPAQIAGRQAHVTYDTFGQACTKHNQKWRAKTAIRGRDCPHACPSRSSPTNKRQQKPQRSSRMSSIAKQRLLSDIRKRSERDHRMRSVDLRERDSSIHEHRPQKRPPVSPARAQEHEASDTKRAESTKYVASQRKPGDAFPPRIATRARSWRCRGQSSSKVSAVGRRGRPVSKTTIVVTACARCGGAGAHGRRQGHTWIRELFRYSAKA